MNIYGILSVTFDPKAGAFKRHWVTLPNGEPWASPSMKVADDMAWAMHVEARAQGLKSVSYRARKYDESYSLEEQ